MYKSTLSFKPHIPTSETAEQFLWTSAGGAIFCWDLLCFEKILSTFRFNHGSFLLCCLVEESHLVLRFLNISSLLFLQLLLLATFAYGYDQILQYIMPKKLHNFINVTVKAAHMQQQSLIEKWHEFGIKASSVFMCVLSSDRDHNKTKRSSNMGSCKFLNEMK